MYSIWNIMCFFNINACQHILLHQIHKIKIFKKASYDPFKVLLCETIQKVHLLAALMTSSVMKLQMAQDDGSLMEIDDIHSIKILGTSWLIHVTYTANQLTALVNIH